MPDVEKAVGACLTDRVAWDYVTESLDSRAALAACDHVETCPACQELIDDVGKALVASTVDPCFAEPISEIPLPYGGMSQGTSSEPSPLGFILLMGFVLAAIAVVVQPVTPWVIAKAHVDAPVGAVRFFFFLVAAACGVAWFRREKLVVQV